MARLGRIVGKFIGLQEKCFIESVPSNNALVMDKESVYSV